MSANTAISALPPTLSPEIFAFARKQGVEQYLLPLVALTQRTFSTAELFEVFLEGDPEIADDWHIVFRLDVPLDVQQSLDADRAWIEGLARICPKPLACVFRLSLDLVP